MQLLQQLLTKFFETLQVFSTQAEAVHVVWTYSSDYFFSLHCYLGTF